MMTDAIDIREISGCTCLRLRRLTRQLTQAYDQALQAAGLTVNQFGLLATLYGLTGGGRTSLSIGALADRLGMHPTTLNRDLKPLLREGLIADVAEAGDRRVRALVITRAGRAKLRQALPYWRHAQRGLEQALGAEAARDLNHYLDLAAGKLLRSS
jgi:DNA-binding MarR family transcriptional regulator